MKSTCILRQVQRPTGHATRKHIFLRGDNAFVIWLLNPLLSNSKQPTLNSNCDVQLSLFNTLSLVALNKDQPHLRHATTWRSLRHTSKFCRVVLVGHNTRGCSFFCECNCPERDASEFSSKLHIAICWLVFKESCAVIFHQSLESEMLLHHEA